MFNYVSQKGIILALFAAVTTAVISFTYVSTKDEIALRKKEKLLSVLNEVVPPAIYDNRFFANCTVVTSDMLGPKDHQRVYRALKDGTPVAVAIETTAPNGYGGAIDLVIGVDINGEVLGVRAVEHQETPGLGDKIELAISDWILSFTGKSYTDDNAQQWRVKKDGGQFDQFTGATITPRAVVGKVADTLQYFTNNKQQLFSQANNCDQPDNELLQTKGDNE